MNHKWQHILRGAAAINRRRFLKLTSSAIALAYAGRSVAAIEDQLTMMGWAEYISPENIEAWEELTGARLIFDAYASNDEMYSKLQLGAGKSGYDVGMNTDFMMPLLIKSGLIQKLDRSLIPNFENLHPEVAGPDFDPENAYSIPKSWGSQGLIYDRKVVNRELKSWEDFLDAGRNEASGRVLLLDDALAIAPFFWAKGISWNTTDESALKSVENEVEEFAKHVQTFNTYPVQDVGSGVIPLAQIWNGYAKIAMDSADDLDLVFEYPQPTTEIWFDSYHIPTGAASIEAAHSWMNFVLEPEVAAREIIYTGFLAPVTGVDEFLPPDVANNTMIFPPAEVMRRGEQTQRNETYDRRVQIFAKLKAAAAAA